VKCSLRFVSSGVGRIRHLTDAVPAKWGNVKAVGHLARGRNKMSWLSDYPVIFVFTGSFR
jgi:hypothetical protein